MGCMESDVLRVPKSLSITRNRVAPVSQCLVLVIRSCAHTTKASLYNKEVWTIEC
jgi:hypothetical protein